MTSARREAMYGSGAQWGGGYLLINLAEGTDEWQSFVATVNEMPIPKVSVSSVKSRLSVCKDSMRRVK
jgi:hypothetical protein